MIGLVYHSLLPLLKVFQKMLWQFELEICCTVYMLVLTFYQKVHSLSLTTMMEHLHEYQKNENEKCLYKVASSPLG